MRQQTPENTENGNTGLPFEGSYRIVWAVPAIHGVYMYRKNNKRILMSPKAMKRAGLAEQNWSRTEGSLKNSVMSQLWTGWAWSLVTAPQHTLLALLKWLIVCNQWCPQERKHTEISPLGEHFKNIWGMSSRFDGTALVLRSNDLRTTFFLVCLWFQCHLHDSSPTGTAKPLHNQKCNEKDEVLIAFPLTTLSALGHTESLQVRFSGNWL